MAAMPPNYSEELKISGISHSDDDAVSFEHYNDYSMDEECALKMRREEDEYTSIRGGRVTHSDDVRAADADNGDYNDCSMDQQCAQRLQSKEDDNANVYEINRIYIEDEEMKRSNLAKRWSAGVPSQTESCVTTLDVQCWTPYGESLYK